MKHNFVWNSLSFAESTNDAVYLQLENALIGLARIPREGDAAALYFDGSDSLLNRRISDGYTVADFVEHLQNAKRHDIAALLFELEDKANAIEELSDEIVYEIANRVYYFVEQGFERSIDFLAIAAEIDGILFGVKTAELWGRHELQFAVYQADEGDAKPYGIYSVCDAESGQSVAELLYAEEPEKSLTELLPNCVLSANFQDWCAALLQENSRIVRKKLKLAHDRGFGGGEPLFKTLKDADGMRELRMGAHAGGAIRILFGSLKNGQTALLVGFIKKSDNEGYEENIKLATPLWAAISKGVQTS